MRWLFTIPDGINKTFKQDDGVRWVAWCVGLWAVITLLSWCGAWSIAEDDEALGCPAHACLTHLFGVVAMEDVARQIFTWNDTTLTDVQNNGADAQCRKTASNHNADSQCRRLLLNQRADLLMCEWVWRLGWADVELRIVTCICEIPWSWKDSWLIWRMCALFFLAHCAQRGATSTELEPSRHELEPYRHIPTSQFWSEVEHIHTMRFVWALVCLVTFVYVDVCTCVYVCVHVCVKLVQCVCVSTRMRRCVYCASVSVCAHMRWIICLSVAYPASRVLHSVMCSVIFWTDF